MNTTRSIHLVFAALFMLATAAWFFLTDPPKLTLNKNKEIPDHRFQTLHVQQFDQEGHIMYNLKAPSGYHLPGSDTFYITTPHVIVTKPKQPTWTIDAEKAVVTAKGQEIRLEKNVTVQHDAYKDQAAGLFKTEAITYFPKQKVASTPLKILWEQGENHMEAEGMDANLATRHIELHKNIQGTYRPAHD